MDGFAITYTALAKLALQHPVKNRRQLADNVCLLYSDAVTEVQFTLMPVSVTDTDAVRPVMPFCQLKRHLTSSADKQSNGTVGCINVQLLQRHTQVLAF